MKTYKEFVETLNEGNYDEKKAKLNKAAAKHKKAGTEFHVSFKDARSGKTVTGRYGGIMNRGGNPYAKVHANNMLYTIPLPQVNVNEQYIDEFDDLDDDDLAED